MNEVPCIVCNKNLRTISPESDEVNHPADGTVFLARGNYGSTVHDPIDPKFLEVNICDECLVERAETVLIADMEHGTAVYNKWDPPERHYQVHAASREGDNHG